MTYRSEEELNDHIEEAAGKVQKYNELLSLLNELKERRSKDPVHKAFAWVRIKKKGKNFNRISEVTCTCGHITRYKVPLGENIGDFECPKKGK